MVLTSDRSNPYLYEFCSGEQNPAYYTEHSFDHTPPTKPALSEQYHALYPEAIEQIPYSGWNSTSEDAVAYFLHNQQISHEPYSNGYSLDPAPTIYMTGYHAMEYNFGMKIEDLSGLRTEFYPPTRIYMSPYGDIEQCPQYPQTSWSPSEPSVASSSPPYDGNWDHYNSGESTGDFGTQNEEVLQGLGLYDCPELIANDGSPRETGKYLGLGKGLKLEESFELTAEYFQNDELESV